MNDSSDPHLGRAESVHLEAQDSFTKDVGKHSEQPSFCWATGGGSEQRLLTVLTSCRKQQCFCVGFNCSVPGEKSTQPTVYLVKKQ